jgi:DNA-binding transcriptional ArsR family regulator
MTSTVISTRHFYPVLALLREALAPTIRVALRAPGAKPPTVEITQSDGAAYRLRLVPWVAKTAMSHSEMSGERAGEARAWLVSRATAAQRQQWRERDDNFVDLSGAVRLHLPTILVDRTDLDPASRLSRDPRSQTRNPFADRASLVVRVLLQHPKETWTGSALARAAGVSLPTVSLATEALREAGLVRVTRAGRTSAIELVDPTAVIMQWAQRYDWRRNRAVAFAAPVGSPERFLHRLPKMLGHAMTTGRVSRRARSDDRRWALTLQAGAALVAPYAKWDRIHAYVEAEGVDDLVEIGARAGWPISAEGKLVLLAPYYRTSVWHARMRVHGLPVVSQTQLILDLWNYPVRGREQAEKLMQQAGWANHTAHVAT